MPQPGKIEFEISFRPQQGRTWPQISLELNDVQLGDHIELSDDVACCKFAVAYSRSNQTTIGITYHKNSNETVVEQGNIVSDQSLELLHIRADGILLEPWVWTEHSYYPSYFPGFLAQNPQAPTELRSQLIWHFPGKYIMTGWPPMQDFWSWYQQQRTQRVLQGLVDPTGQISSNHRGMDDNDRRLASEIRDLLNV